ncbi:MAG: hypothetical protein KDA87_10110, partial [Planctomycetales bacterium]|nr:hypothetical protein [Planctomycetales bacterium]
MNHSFFHSKSMLAVTIAVLLQAANAPSAEAQLEIAQLNHPAKVSFQSEILPVLRKNCLACHNETDAESSLVLETPARMLEGGFEGPAVVPGKPEESYLFQLAAHTTEPIMPPEDNSAGAINLSPQELALLKQWITEGATDDSGESANQVAWQSLPPGVNPVFAVAMSGDGQIVAAGRANQISVYDVNSKRELQRLTDPALLESGVYDKPGVAHLDMVQALAFSRDGEWIASGGYRTLKLWRRQADMEPAETKPNNAADPSLLMPGIGADDLTAKISETIAVSVQANQMQVWSRTDGSSDWKSDHSIELASPAKQILPLGDSSFATLGQNNQFQVWNAQGNAT